MSYSQESADVAALRVLGWLAANEDLLPVFLGASGAGRDDLRAGASDPVFLGQVLDFILMDDAWVVAACDACDLRYDTLGPLRQALPGGEEVSWT
jgi:hypothetical protein